MAICFYLRFRSGKWKAMRVIEPELETIPEQGNQLPSWEMPAA